MTDVAALKPLISSVTLVLGIIFFGCGGGSDPVKNAEVLFDLGKYDKALEVLEAALIGDPKNAEVHLLRGKTYLALGKIDDADDAFSDAIAVGGKSAAKKVDALVLAEFKRVYQENFSPKDGLEERELAQSVRSLELLNSYDAKEDALRWGFDFLLSQEVQMDRIYLSFYQSFAGSSDLDGSLVQSEFFNAVEELARRAESDDRYFAVVGGLARSAKSEDERRRIEELLDPSMAANEDIVETTMEDIRALAAAFEAYAMDNDAYPEATTLEEVLANLVPEYVSQEYVQKDNVWQDGWGTPFEIRSQKSGFIIVSAGSDKNFDSTYTTLEVSKKGAVDGFAHDIVFLNTKFVQHPNVR